MALTKFVKNVQDLSDDGGFKFRFACDRCGSGYESQYVSSKANLLKTAVQAFQVFRWAGWGAQTAVEGLDRGLRGKERDSAYESAVHEAMVQFKPCAGCGQWVCPERCWNEEFGLCETCAPSAREAASRRAAEIVRDRAVDEVERAPEIPPLPVVTCPVCHQQTQGGKFCQACGSPLGTRACKSCGKPLTPAARFCGECGVAAS
ncbi:MAG: zinc ribbon domain-containing protein [Vicinamibacterales bacterium]